MRRLLLLLSLVASAAQAGNSVSGVTVTYHASLASIAVTAVVRGDDDSSAVCVIQQGRNSPSSAGMTMVRRVGANVYHGRILWLRPGERVYFRVEVTDGGIRTYSPTEVVEVATVRPQTVTGGVFYTNQATGNDGNPGTLASPNKTINGSLTDMGDCGNCTVVVAPGHYHERLDLNFGTDGRFRTITGDRTNRDSTIICGANEHGEAGRIDDTNNISWSLVGNDVNGRGIYRTLLRDTDCATCYADSIGSVVLGFGEYLHRKTSAGALYHDSTGANSQGNLAMGGEPSGWWWQNDSLYVKRKSGASPAGAGNPHFGYRRDLISVDRRNWRIANLTIRYGGGRLGDGSWPMDYAGDVDPGTSGNGVLAGRNSGNASGLVVDSCLIYGNNGIGVYATYTDPSTRADSVTVANSTFDGLTIGSMAYAAAKGRTEEDANGCKVTGSQSNVYQNVVRETHNGIQTSPSAGQADSAWAYNSEVYGNRISRLSDDAIELDGTHGINQLVAMNTTDSTGSGISATTLYHGGPVLAVYNTCTRFKQAGVKLGDNSTALMRFYHNTFASEEANGRAFEGSSGGKILGTVVLENNIFSGKIGIAGPSAPDTTGSRIRFNYNLVDSTGAGRLISWAGTSNYLNWSTWTTNAALLQDANSFYGDPRFLAFRALAGVPAVPDVRLRPDSPAFGAGRVIAGVNTGLDGPRYTGAPDIGSRTCLTCARATPTGAVQ